MVVDVFCRCSLVLTRDGSGGGTLRCGGGRGGVGGGSTAPRLGSSFAHGYPTSQTTYSRLSGPYWSRYLLES